MIYADRRQELEYIAAYWDRKKVRVYRLMLAFSAAIFVVQALLPETVAATPNRNMEFLGIVTPPEALGDPSEAFSAPALSATTAPLVLPAAFETPRKASRRIIATHHRRLSRRRKVRRVSPRNISLPPQRQWGLLERRTMWDALAKVTGQPMDKAKQTTRSIEFAEPTPAVAPPRIMPIRIRLAKVVPTEEKKRIESSEEKPESQSIDCSDNGAVSSLRCQKGGENISLVENSSFSSQQPRNPQPQNAVDEEIPILPPPAMDEETFARKNVVRKNDERKDAENKEDENEYVENERDENEDDENKVGENEDATFKIVEGIEPRSGALRSKSSSEVPAKEETNQSQGIEKVEITEIIEPTPSPRVAA